MHEPKEPATTSGDAIPPETTASQFKTAAHGSIIRPPLERFKFTRPKHFLQAAAQALEPELDFAKAIEKLEKAMGILETGAEKFPENAHMKIKLGMIYSTLATHYHDASRLYPKYLDKSQGCLSRGNYCFFKAQPLISELDPEFPAYLDAHALNLTKINMCEEAEKIYARLYEATTFNDEGLSAQHLMNMGYSYRRWAVYYHRHGDSEKNRAKLSLAQACYGQAYMLSKDEGAWLGLEDATWYLNNQRINPGDWSENPDSKLVIGVKNNWQWVVGRLTKIISEPHPEPHTRTITYIPAHT